MTTCRSSTTIGYESGSLLKTFDFRTKRSHSYETWSENRIFAVNIGPHVLIGTNRSDDCSSAFLRLLKGPGSEQIYEIPIKFPVKRIVHSDGVACVVGERAVCLYRISDGSLHKLQPTSANVHGCADVCNQSDRVVMCCPGLQRGTLRIERISQDSSNASVITAHESSLQAISLAGNGAYVATVSDTGSVIRVHSTIEPCDLLVEFRRTSLLKAPKVSSLFLSPTGSFVGTVDEESFLVSIFKTPVSVNSHLVFGSRDESSPLSVLNSIVSVCQICMGSSAWASFKIPSMNSKILKVSASFGSDPYTVIVGALSTAGPVGFLYRFDPRESNAITLARCEFLESTTQGDDCDFGEFSKTCPDDKMASTEETEEWTFLGPSDESSISW